MTTLAIIALALTLPSVGRLVPGAFYTFGCSVNDDGVVTAVAEGGPAARAGVRVGDQIDLPSMPSAERDRALFGLVAQRRALKLPIVTGRSPRTVTLVSAPQTLPQSTAATLLLRQALGVLFIVLGAAVVLRRPSVATWAFFLYCLRNNGSSFLGALAIAPDWLLPPVQVLNILLVVVGGTSFLLFALYFPVRDRRSWRVAFERAVPYFGIALFIPFLLDYVLPVVLGIRAQWLSDFLFFFSGGYLILGYVILFDTYRRSRGVVRQQVEWVVLGFGIGITAELLAFATGVFSFAVSPTVVGVLFSGMALGPISVAYAIFRHHVLDVNFVISRTIVYAALTTVLVAGFSLLDFGLHQMLASSRLALVAELGAAVGVGFWMNGLHRGADRLVDRTLFRRRYEAERRLERAAAGLLHAGSQAAVDRMLVNEPLGALQLASAALFRAADGRFRRTAAEGWDSNCSTSLDADDPLLLHMHAGQDALNLTAVGRTALAAPNGPARPAIVLPLVVRHQVVGFALFGSHVNGERLDPDEIKTLEHLLAAAAAAYDHLEAVVLRERCNALERRLAELGG